MDCSLPGSSVRGIFQATILEWAAISFSNYLLEFTQIHVHWWYPAISSSAALFSSCLQIFPNIKLFSSELALHIRWPKYWSFSFSISPSNWHSGLISFKIDWSPCSPRNSQGSSLASQFENINSLALSLLYGSALTSTHDYWKDHNFDWMDLCRQGDVSAF